jgi:Tfp pilus assembly protein PilE
MFKGYRWQETDAGFSLVEMVIIVLILGVVQRLLLIAKGSAQSAIAYN